MFRIKPKATFNLTANLTVPGEDPAPLALEFNYLDRESLETWQKKHGGAPEIEGLSELIVSWSGVEDTDGKPVPYSKAALGQLLGNYHSAGRQILLEYMREVLGTRIKNS